MIFRRLLRVAPKAKIACALTGSVFAGSIASAAPADLYTWGSSQYGQLGHGDQKDNPLPTLVSTFKGKDVVQVAAGSDTTAAITSTGDLYTWGRGQNYVLGHGDDTTINSPTLMEGGNKWKFVSVSGTHTAAVDVTGQLFIWGNRALGRLGVASTPVKVEALSGVQVRSVACGHNHTLAISEDGGVYAWGSNYEGALGLGSRNDHVEPVKIAHLEEHVVKACAGRGFSVLLTREGRVLTCGMNDYGQTAQGTSAERYLRVPTLVRSLSSSKVIDIAAGEFHAACVTEDGRVFAWGLGQDGQIGVGSRNLHNTTPQQIASVEGACGVSCGNGHTAAVTASGALYVWGRGQNGQIGRADKLESMAAHRLEPVKVEYFGTHKQRVAAVSLGGEFSAALAS